MGWGETKSKLTHECVATEVEGGRGLVAGMRGGGGGGDQGVEEGGGGRGRCLYVLKYSTSAAMTWPFSHTPALCLGARAFPSSRAFSACERVVYRGGN